MITTRKSNRSARGDERSRTDSISPLRTEALAGRKVLFWKVIGDALAVVHAPPNMVFGSRSEAR